MPRTKKLAPCAAKAYLQRKGIDFGADFHALRSSQVDSIVAAARRAGYRRRKDAPGSRGRMFFQYLKRIRACPR